MASTGCRAISTHAPCRATNCGVGCKHADQALALLMELQQWQGNEQFVYAQRWEPGMLVMWDNRSVLHRATGGYEGYRRELHRTTIAAWDGA